MHTPYLSLAIVVVFVLYAIVHADTRSNFSDREAAAQAQREADQARVAAVQASVEASQAQSAAAIQAQSGPNVHANVNVALAQWKSEKAARVAQLAQQRAAARAALAEQKEAAERAREAAKNPPVLTTADVAAVKNMDPEEQQAQLDTVASQEQNIDAQVAALQAQIKVLQAQKVQFEQIRDAIRPPGMFKKFGRLVSGKRVPAPVDPAKVSNASAALAPPVVTVAASVPVIASTETGGTSTFYSS